VYSYAKYIPAIKAIADETRLKIIDMLSCGQLCACEILAAFTISQSTLSYHMKILQDSGLVDGVRDGSWMRYTLNQEKANEVLGFLTHITNQTEDCICQTYKNNNSCKID